MGALRRVLLRLGHADEEGVQRFEGRPEHGEGVPRLVWGVFFFFVCGGELFVGWGCFLVLFVVCVFWCFWCCVCVCGGELIVGWRGGWL